jgi:hypothetical protein
LHTLRFGEPFGDAEFVTILSTGAFETWVVKKESNGVAMAGARTAGEGFDIAACQRPKPAPGSAECSHCAGVDVIDNLLTREEASGKNTD